MFKGTHFWDFDKMIACRDMSLLRVMFIIRFLKEMPYGKLSLNFFNKQVWRKYTINVANSSCVAGSRIYNGFLIP